MKKCNYLLSILLVGSLYLGSVTSLPAQHWQKKVRGSWVITDSTKNGGRVLVDHAETVEISHQNNRKSYLENRKPRYK